MKTEIITPVDAYEFTMQKVNELKKDGIGVIITPCRLKTDKDTIEKYDKPDRIPPEKWVNVSFENLDKGQTIKIHETANYLMMCGITFDTGGAIDNRDWELDWSFSYIKGKEDWEQRDAVEDIINNLK